MCEWLAEDDAQLRVASMRTQLCTESNEEKLKTICDQGLTDNWSQVREVCANTVQAGPELIKHWIEQIKKNQWNWRAVHGYCLAFASASDKQAIYEAALVAVIPIGLYATNAQARDAAVRVIASLGNYKDELEIRLIEIIHNNTSSAYAKCGALAALEKLESIAWPSHIDSALHVFGHEASIVRQAAATLCQRQVAKNPILFQLLHSLSIKNEFNQHQVEALLMLLDGVISDEANTALLHDAASPYLKIAIRVVKHYFCITPCTNSFEVYRAARQLAATVAIAQLCTPDDQFTLIVFEKNNIQLASFLLSRACLFARYCAEIVGCCGQPLVKRWGTIHDGAGDDAESVQRREKTILHAVKNRADILQERIVERFYKHALIALNRFRCFDEEDATTEEALAGLRLIAFVSSENDDRCVMRCRRRYGSSDSLHSPTVSAPDILAIENPQVRAVRSSDSVEESLFWCLRDRAWDHILLAKAMSLRTIEPVLADAYAVLSCRADDALNNAKLLLEWLILVQNDTCRATYLADALISCLRSAVERARISLSTEIQCKSSALDAWLNDFSPHPAVAVSSAPCVVDEFHQALSSCNNLAHQIIELLAQHQEQPQLITRFLRILALTCAFATAAPTNKTFLNLPFELAEICATAAHCLIPVNYADSPQFTVTTTEDEDNEWDNWDDDFHDDQQENLITMTPRSLLMALQNDFPIFHDQRPPVVVPTKFSSLPPKPPQTAVITQSTLSVSSSSAAY
uniref:Uncharacterized protein n=1 Tax=Aureoumbra lagunensis TaxID=44058 RepID=A0A7S3NPI2_9STRA|mmetsp:Transcript_14111/g.21316  ORF Transcript_14111/g.21316 Transcript_14111/m.21316 type:complete len:747 (+) Transcript_14111:27-2267(+)